MLNEPSCSIISYDHHSSGNFVMRFCRFGVWVVWAVWVLRIVIVSTLIQLTSTWHSSIIVSKSGDYNWHFPNSLCARVQLVWMFDAWVNSGLVILNLVLLSTDLQFMSASNFNFCLSISANYLYPSQIHVYLTCIRHLCASIRLVWRLELWTLILLPPLTDFENCLMVHL